MALTRYVAVDDDALDLIAYHKYGYSSGAVEAILNLPENKSLRDAGQKLSAGDVVWLPEITEEVKPVARLYD